MERDLSFVLETLTKREKFKMIIVITLQCLISLLDVIGVLLVGVLGGILLGTDAALQEKSRIPNFLASLGIDNIGIREQAVFVGVVILVLLSAKSALSIFLNWRLNLFLSRKVADFGKELIASCFKTDYQKFREFSIQEILLATTKGSSAMYLKSLLGRVNIAVDLFLLSGIFIGLLWFNFLIAIIAIPLFLILAAIIYSVSNPRAKKASDRDTSLTIGVNEFTHSILENFKIVKVNGSSENLNSHLLRMRLNQARTVARLNFMPTLNKYVFEISTIFIIFIFGAAIFLLFTIQQSFALLGVFLAASTRIAPALARIQQSNLQIRSASGTVDLTIDIFSSYQSAEIRKAIAITPTNEIEEFSNKFGAYSGIVMSEGCLIANDGKEILKRVNLAIAGGSRIGIIGESGSGKTSLVECILGLTPLTSGSVTIGGLSWQELIRLSPNHFGYVPQSTSLPFKSLKENVKLGRDYLKDSQILEALSKAGLNDLIEEIGFDLDYDLSNRGRQLSGGEIQRIAIAQALVNDPAILILDEATSALDSETENEIIENLKHLPQYMTILLITHRLAALRGLNRVFLMENGELKEISFRQIKP